MPFGQTDGLNESRRVPIWRTGEPGGMAARAPSRVSGDRALLVTTTPKANVAPGTNPRPVTLTGGCITPGSVEPHPPPADVASAARIGRVAAYVEPEARSAPAAPPPMTTAAATARSTGCRLAYRLAAAASDPRLGRSENTSADRAPSIQPVIRRYGGGCHGGSRVNPEHWPSRAALLDALPSDT